jgi:hypothetical protein
VKLQILGLFLLAALFLPAALKLTVYVEFISNRQYILQALCENRADPNSTCQGMCHLKKEIEKVERTQDTPIERIQFLKSIEFSEFIPKPIFFLKNLTESLISIQEEVFLCYRFDYHFTFASSHFKPPISDRFV